MKSFGAILGSSGTGKGTRVNQLIKFFESKFESEDYFITFNDKKFQLGILFPELDLLILGKYNHNKKSQHITWSSLDQLWSKFGGTEPTVAYFKTLPYNILCEGYSNTDTFRIRPEHMSSGGCRKLFYQVYSYGLDNFNEYVNRIKGRNGKPPKGTTAFDKETQILKFPEKIKEEYKRIGIEDGVCSHLSFDAPIWSIGVEYIQFLEENNLCKEDTQITHEFIDFTMHEENQTFYEFKKNEFEELF